MAWAIDACAKRPEAVTFPTRVFFHGGSRVTTVCFHGGLLVSGGHDSRIKVWELNDRAPGMLAAVARARGTGGKMQCTHLEMPLVRRSASHQPRLSYGRRLEYVAPVGSGVLSSSTCVYGWAYHVMRARSPAAKRAASSGERMGCGSDA